MAKILVLSCGGGGGHISAATAIQEHLTEHKVEIIDVLGNTFAPIDPLYWLSKGHGTGQDLYNYLLKNNLKRTVNVFYQVGWLLWRFTKKPSKKLLQQLFLEKKPDIIISVIPIINGALSELASSTKIPTLIIPTDLDLRSFTAHMKPNSYTWLGICFDNPEIKALIQPNVIDPNRLQVIGFPIRPDFAKGLSKEQDSLRTKFNIPTTIPTILIIMGAAGSTALIRWVKTLLTISIPCHLLICVGRNTALAARIEQIEFPNHIQRTIFNNNANIAQLMASADLCLSKPGSVTFAETIYMKLPVFLDGTSRALIWEAYNLHFAKTRLNSIVLSSYKDAARHVQEFFINKKFKEQLTTAVANVHPPHFGKNLKNLISKILHEEK